MRDKDAHLIFENYNNRVLLNEADNDWGSTALEVLDPTGISSWDDLGEAIDEYEKEPGSWNFVKMLFNVYLVIPNFGLLAAGWGGIGWAALRAAIKKAIAEGLTGNTIKIGNKILKIIQDTPLLTKAMLSLLSKLVEKGTIRAKTAQEIGYLLSKGRTINDIAHAQNVSQALKRVDVVKDIAKKEFMGEPVKKIGRAADEPERFFSNIKNNQEEQKGPTKEAAAKSASSSKYGETRFVPRSK
jgi:hypothetical protein